MKKIPIRKNPDLFALVDNIDYEFLCHYKWFCGYKNTPVKQVYTPGINHKTSTISMRRYILQVDHSVRVKHKDGNRLNNQRKNLLVVPVRKKE